MGNLCCNANDLDSILTDQEITGPGKEATRNYCLGLMKNGSYDIGIMGVIASSYYDGVMAQNGINN
jgi:hypothetical protein